MSDSLHDLVLGPGPISETEQARRRDRFVQRLLDAERTWQVPKTAADAYRNIANDWQNAYEQQAADLAQCRALLAALAHEAQREHNAMAIARNCTLCDAIGESIEWLKEHPAPEGGQGDDTA